MAIALIVSGTASAQRGAWTARPPAGEIVSREAMYTNGELEAGGIVRVWVTDVAGRTIFEARLPGPRWTTPAGADCEAMGIAGVDLVRHGEHLDLRVEISVGDLCEAAAPRYAIVETPLR